MSQHSTPYAVPAVGMRKVLICPVCGDAFLATPQHRWIAYIPRMRVEKPVCSYHCMREMERRAGRYTAKELFNREQQEETTKAKREEGACTAADELFALMRQKESLERQMQPVSRMVEQAIGRKQKISAKQKKELFDREKQLMRRMGDVNRRIREVQRYGGKQGPEA